MLFKPQHDGPIGIHGITKPTPYLMADPLVEMPLLNDTSSLPKTIETSIVYPAEHIQQSLLVIKWASIVIGLTQLIMLGLVLSRA